MKNYLNYTYSKIQKMCDDLKKITFEDININDVKVKILGIYFNDFKGELKIKKHKHSFFEFSYALNEKMHINVNGNNYEVKEGYFYMLPKGVYHSHDVEKGINYNAISIRWEFEKLSDKYRGEKWYRLITNFNNAGSKPIEDNGNVLYALKNLFYIVKENKTTIEMKLAFCQLLLSILEFYTVDNKLKEVSNKKIFNIDNNVVDMAKDFIENNYKLNINVHDVANSVYLSYSHLSRLFKKYEEQTVNEYIINTRLKNAQILLLTTDKNITQIANQVGFKSENYFCKVFKRKYNMLPKKMRMSKSAID